jgi:hypothetical protein
MIIGKLAAMRLEDVAEAIKGGKTWQGTRIFILHPHGHQTGSRYAADKRKAGSAPGHEGHPLRRR